MPCIRSRSKLKTNSLYTPETFLRKTTAITLYSIKDLEPHNLPAWKAIHAVLNASPEGRLSTEELWDTICLRFPMRNFVKTTLSHSLSHSADFAQVVSDGKSPCLWFLTGRCDGVKRGGKSGCHEPVTFDRQYTQYKLNSIEPGPPVWKMIHAVLNDCDKGCLTTREVKEAIRLRYRREIPSRTLSYNLTQSDDFEQVFFEGKVPGRWFLTGTSNGIHRTNTTRATGSREAPGLALRSASDGNEYLVTDKNEPFAHEISYISENGRAEAQYHTGAILPSPTWLSTSAEFNLNSPPPTSRTIVESQATNGYQACPLMENMQRYESPNSEVQLDTLSSQSDTKRLDSAYFTPDDICALLTAFPVPLSPLTPSRIPSIDDPLLDNSFFSDSTPASRSSIGASPHHTLVTYPGGFEPDATAISGSIGRLDDRSSKKSFFQEDSVQQCAFSEEPGAIKESTAQELVSSTLATERPVLLHASPMPTRTTYSSAYVSYNGSSDSSRVIGGMTSFGRTQAEREVTMAGLPYATFGFLGEAIM